ncbi:MAG: hypothetical protein O2819_03715 [Planctomycetota bacterium]|nr:hypothetical protein [Planctomycetota bacterium]
MISARHRPPDGTLPPIMPREELLASLARINTHLDAPDSACLYGPGVRIELPADPSPTQLLVTVDDEDTAWPYLLRLVKTLPVRVLNLETNHELGAPRDDPAGASVSGPEDAHD